MAHPHDTVSPYDADAARFANQFESLSPAEVHDGYLDLIPRPRDGTALDVGAGSGRDAAWLASHGYTVTAVEPAQAMRLEGQRRHPEEAIRWLDDRLPGLTQVHRLVFAGDFDVVNAVHIGSNPSFMR